MLSKVKIGFISVLIPLITIVYGIFAHRMTLAADSAYSAVCIILFIIIHKKFPVLTHGVYISVIIFILLSAFAGRALNWYARIPYWDKLLHFVSGFIFVPAGRQIYNKINPSYTSLKAVRLFALFFAIAAAALWEICEFTCDSLFGTTAQNNSLDDTMVDMLAGTISAAIATVVSAIKHRR